ncbi:hypothetical protein B7P34_06245 [Streptosporangium nondiastaticum]|uniref:Clp R domain-containing protein n=1 Tax=Streptosporangium nondiastaticum TaxID=35764 RepID=A0A9X7JTK8_9ACTN|nr:Clp protease N-terminal domain-containing protein [Streptosporangium nondiastaticum]PSJ29655.1 hypothetical protein B7P34_06245 [Streptosporangium nondiastaticum]
MNEPTAVGDLVHHVTSRRPDGDALRHLTDAVARSVSDAAIYERFTPRTRADIAASEDEARAAGHDCGGTERIVLGLLSQPVGLAAKFLATETTPEQVRTRWPKPSAQLWRCR